MNVRLVDMLAELEQDHIKMMHGPLDRALRWRDRQVCSPLCSSPPHFASFASDAGEYEYITILERGREPCVDKGSLMPDS